MNIGRFKKHRESDLSGSIATLGIQLSPVRFVRQDKGADYTVHGPDDVELGAAWRKSGEWGAYLSVRLDCPTLPSPISATLKLTPTEDGWYVLRWNRRNENGRAQKTGSQPDRPE